MGARLLLQSYQYPNLSEGADRVGGQLRGDEECPFSGVTKSGRVWRKVLESDARSVPWEQTSAEHCGGEDLLENHGKVLGVHAHVGKWPMGSCLSSSAEHGGGEDLLEDHGKVLGVHAHVGVAHGQLLVQPATSRKSWCLVMLAPYSSSHVSVVCVCVSVCVCVCVCVCV